MKRLLAITGLLAVTGCASYQSRFEVAGNTFVMPKDAVFSYLQISIPSTNGAISLVISNGSFKMNPAIIDAATAHDVAVINATSQAIGDIAGKAAAAAVKP